MIDYAAYNSDIQALIDAVDKVAPARRGGKPTHQYSYQITELINDGEQLTVIPVIDSINFDISCVGEQSVVATAFAKWLETELQPQGHIRLFTLLSFTPLESAAVSNEYTFSLTLNGRLY